MRTNILIVEDTVETRDLITILVERSGFDVIVANDGQEGFAKACTEKPALIITDIRMPKMDGIEMIGHLRAHPECRQVPIVAVTAFGREYADRAMQAGANRALAHPLNTDLLISLVRDLLKDRSPDDLSAAPN